MDVKVSFSDGIVAKITIDNNYKVKEEQNIKNIKILMLKGEKGDTGTTDYNKLINKPTKLSNFINDGVFITNTVNNLTNYYTKSNSYSQTQINNLMSAKANKDEIITDYNDLNNTPTSLTDFSGVLPIEQGGTGATNAKDAITNLGTVPIYTAVTDLISLPTTTSEIIQAMPYPSILMTWVDNTSNSITDLPCSYGTLTIHKRSGTRLQILYNRSYEGTVNGNHFYFGNYNTSSKTVTWNRIFTNYSGCQVPIANGGTGASNASVARTNLDVYSKAEVDSLINSLK